MFSPRFHAIIPALAFHARGRLQKRGAGTRTLPSRISNSYWEALASGLTETVATAARRGDGRQNGVTTMPQWMAKEVREVRDGDAYGAVAIVSAAWIVCRHGDYVQREFSKLLQ